MSRYAVLFALALAGCSSSSSPSGPRKDVDWGDRRPVRREPAPSAKDLQPTPLTAPVPSAK